MSETPMDDRGIAIDTVIATAKQHVADGTENLEADGGVDVRAMVAGRVVFPIAAHALLHSFFDESPQTAASAAKAGYDIIALLREVHDLATTIYQSQRKAAN